MAQAVPAVLAGWVVVVLALFRFLPGRTAAAIGLIAGWAILPVASYPAAMIPASQGEPTVMHALALPSALAWNKATAIGLACLAGVVLFDGAAIRMTLHRVCWVDLAMAVWCLVPLPSALSNRLGLAEGLVQVRANILAWGVPYLMGRVYFADLAGLQTFLTAWAIAGMAYVVPCLLEFVQGPFLYDWFYGAHPYRFSGSARPIGHRPMVFLENGNQLGIWVTTAAASAIALWRVGRPSRLLGMPVAVVAAILAGLVLLCQSHGAILLLLLALPFLMRFGSRTRINRGAVISIGVTALILAAIAVAAGLGPLRSQVRGLFQSVGKNSFTWRLARYEESLPAIAERPILGHGLADWSHVSGDGTFVDPASVGLWLHATGRYGLIGLLAVSVVLLAPWFGPRLRIRDPLIVASLTLLAIHLGDLTLNSTFIMPILAITGSLARFENGRSEKP